MKDEEILTMEDKCFVCGKKQGVNQPFEYYEVGNGHITFCSEKCKKIHNTYGKNMVNYGKSLARADERAKCEEEIEELSKRLTNQIGVYNILKQQLSDQRNEFVEMIKELPVYKKNLDLKDILEFKQELLSKINKGKKDNER